MTVEHVEIHQIDIAQPFKVHVDKPGSDLHSLRIARGGKRPGESATGEEVVDLADRDDVAPGVPEGVEHGFGGRL